jgi:hypothetical protein
MWTRSRIAWAVCFALLVSPATAQTITPQIGGGISKGGIGEGGITPPFSPSVTPPPVSYVGPGDIVSGATAWYGLRAYNAAYAAGANNAINIRRASDNTTTNIVILANGKLDIATANTFAGKDATCQGSTTGLSTTIAFTSCSSTPNALDTVSGGGFIQPAYLVSCGSFVAGAGTCTLNVAQNIAVAETITMQVAMFVTEMYDQTGNSNHVTQGTAAKQPALIPSCIGSLPCVGFVRTSTQILFSSTTPGATQPITIVTVNEPTANDTNQKDYFTIVGDTEVGYVGTNLSTCYSGNFVNTVAAQVNQFHALNTVVNNTSTVVAVDGVESTINCGVGNPTGAIGVGGYGNGSSNPFQGNIAEAGMWSNDAFTGPQRASMCKNQQAYYGAGNFGGPC